MTKPVVVAIATHLEPELLERVRAVDARLEVLYDAALLGQPRYVADHHAPIARTPEQEARFLEMLGRAEVVFDFPGGHYRDLATVAPRLRWLQSTSAGIGQMVKRVGLDATDITFTTASGVHARPLADFCLMAMLMFAKDYFRMERDRSARRWERYCGEELTGKTLAVIGLGRVGQEIARHGKRMDMRVVGTRRSSGALEGVDKLFEQSELHAMLRETDFLAIAAPHTPETEGMIGEAELAAMKPSAVLINVGRGVIVDEDALIRALREHRLAGAALDVAREEPPPEDSPLWQLPNVILSPHSASTVTQENDRIIEIFCDNLRRYLRGEPLRNVLDKTKLY
jgi:glyoxylate/hydroxypyruvate reductase